MLRATVLVVALAVAAAFSPALPSSVHVVSRGRKMQLLGSSRRGTVPVTRKVKFVVPMAPAKATPDRKNPARNGDNTQLHFAISGRRLEDVIALIETGANIEATDRSGFTPLHSACLGQNLEIVKVLVEQGANIDAVDTRGETPLFVALKFGMLKSIDDVTRFLLEKGANVDARGTCGETPLHLTCRSGNLEVVKMLCERDANVDAIDKRGTPPLVWACLAGGFEIVKALLEKGADVNIVDDFTPLHYASRMGSLPIVEALLDKGANVNATEKRYGRTPLHLASLEGHIEVVNALLGRGANVQATDGEGMTPADLAEDEGVLGLLAAEWRRRSPYRTRRNWRGSTALWLDSSGKVV